MKQILTTFSALVLFFNSYGRQNADTLRVIVLSPKSVQVSENYKAEYAILHKDLKSKAEELKFQKTKEKDAHKEEFQKQPDYTKSMYENEFSFIDSVTIDNYISMVVREYVAYRLYKPFKIKPRLVFVSVQKANSDLKEYERLSAGYSNLFIINFPSMRIYKENSQLCVATKIELYSNKTKEILLSKEHIGLTKSEMTDMPMCKDGSWDCAFVNSVYPSLFDCLKIIADKK